MMNAHVLRKLPEYVEVGICRTPVIKYHCASGKQTSMDVVPHHPTCGCIPEASFTGFEVVVKDAILQLLQKNSALRMNNCFGEPCCSRGIENPDGMVERNSCKFNRACLFPRHCVP